MSHDPMSHEEAAKNQMVERFVLGELRGSDRERFEAHFFDCQECFDEVQLTSEFLRHARNVLSREQEKSWLSRTTADLWRPAPALVSALFLCALGTAAYQSLRVVALIKPRVESQHFLSGQTRAQGDERRIVVRHGDSVSLSVEFAPGSEFKSYQAQIISVSGKIKYSIPVNPEEGEVSVSIVLPPGSLKEGKYNLFILGNSGSGSSKDVGGGSFYLQLAD